MNLYSDLFYPILRFEDDILSSVKNLDVEKEFYDMLLNTLSEFTPEKIIYSEKDDYAGYAVKHFIKQNYIRKSAYLYELKKKENKTVPRDYSRLMMDQMYKLLGEVPL